MIDKVHNVPAEKLVRMLDKGSAGAIITDPPFFISTTRDGGGEFSDPWSHASSLEEAIQEVRPVVEGAFDSLRAGGALVVMSQGIATTVWDSVARTSGFNWMAEIAVLWNTGKPRNLNFGSLHTHVNWYSKPGAKHTFNSGDRRSIYSNVLVVKKVPLADRSHPSEKPVGLTNFLVSLLTRPEDLIVDPFCGSGSTLVSAEQCGRNWIGSDLDPQYCVNAEKRAQNADFEEVEPVYLWINGKLQEV